MVKFVIKRIELAPTVTVLCTRNSACTNVRAEPFYGHENQCTQILELSSPVLCKSICGIFHFRLRLNFIKVYIFVQQKASTL